jgi:Ser-tRNA(Ala) deacylase AlaX
MTLDELELRLRTVEAELELLKRQQAPQKSWIDLYGAYADDPTFEEAMRLGREERDRVNRLSLEEMDREEAATKPKRTRKPVKKTTIRRGPNARS